MLVEFELQGSRCLHKGIFDTQGFWVKYETEEEELPMTTSNFTVGYKLYSHFSFSFFHEDKKVVDLVYARLISVLRGSNNVEMDEIGYFRKLNK